MSEQLYKGNTNTHLLNQWTVFAKEKEIREREKVRRGREQKTDRQRKTENILREWPREPCEKRVFFFNRFFSKLSYYSLPLWSHLHSPEQIRKRLIWENKSPKWEFVSSKWHLNWEHESDVSQRNFPEIQVCVWKRLNEHLRWLIFGGEIWSTCLILTKERSADVIRGPPTYKLRWHR